MRSSQWISLLERPNPLQRPSRKIPQNVIFPWNHIEKIQKSIQKGTWLVKNPRRLGFESCCKPSCCRGGSAGGRGRSLCSGRGGDRRLGMAEGVVSKGLFVPANSVDMHVFWSPCSNIKTWWYYPVYYLCVFSVLVLPKKGKLFEANP